MKSSLALFLQVVLVGLGLATLAFLIWEPLSEGRNAHATLFATYCQDPFLAYIYVGSLPFFVALFRAFGLFGEIRKTRAFSPATVRALRSIKHCAFALIGFVAGGMVFILLFGDKDDRPAGFFMGFLVTLVASGMAVAAARFGRKLQRS